MRALPSPALFCLFALSLSSVFLPLQALAAKHTEQFTESLKLTALRDGRVLASFAFETILQGALPRDPRTLGGVDDGKCSIYLGYCFLCLRLLSY
jgi:Na+/melibiose symporter-like transporter